MSMPNRARILTPFDGLDDDENLTMLVLCQLCQTIRKLTNHFLYLKTVLFAKQFF